MAFYVLLYGLDDFLGVSSLGDMVRPRQLSAFRERNIVLGLISESDMLYELSHIEKINMNRGHA